MEGRSVWSWCFFLEYLSRIVQYLSSKRALALFNWLTIGDGLVTDGLFPTLSFTVDIPRTLVVNRCRRFEHESLRSWVTLVVVEERAYRLRRPVEPWRDVDMLSRGAKMNIETQFRRPRGYLFRLILINLWFRRKSSRKFSIVRLIVLQLQSFDFCQK